MGVIQSFKGALSGTFADMWKDIITVDKFDERTVVKPGILKQSNNGRGINYKGSEGIISNGSKIFVPENTAAFIFNQSGIEDIITVPGGYIYENGEQTIFNGDGISGIFGQVVNRFTFGGQPSELKRVAFVNLREIRDIKFGTRGPVVYNDIFYGTDLEVLAFGNFSIEITDAKKFIKNYVPANTSYYSFDNENAREQLLSEFLQSFIVALNSLSTTYRISQLPSKANEISDNISKDKYNAGSWSDRFGFSIVKVSIENIELSQESRELIKQFSNQKMNVKAYDDVSQKSSNISAQQKIASGIEQNGLGDGAGLIYGMNVAQNLSTPNEQRKVLTIDEQIELLKKLKSLVDSGILSEDEFNIKKKEILDIL